MNELYFGDNIFNRLKVQVKKTYYVHKRYDTPATFGLIYHEKDLSVIELAEYVRISDQFIKLDENHYFINFAYTSHENAFKASQNLLLKLDNFFGDTSTCIALDIFNTTYPAETVLNRLKRILSQIRQEPYTRLEDENILTNF